MMKYGISRLHANSQYIASPKDLVLGTIVNRHAEGYRVDIGSAQMASLDALAFEGATKRSKPNLKVSYSFGSRYSKSLYWFCAVFGTTSEPLRALICRAGSTHAETK